MKIPTIVWVMIFCGGAGYYLAKYAATDYSSPEYIAKQQKCEQPHLAKAYAASFLKDRLNLVESPDFETWSLEKAVRRASVSGEDCSYWVIDHFVFTNEFGAKARRFAEIKLQPIKGTGSWRLLQMDIR